MTHSPDPGNSPPQMWLEHDYHGTAQQPAAMKLAVKGSGGGGSGCACTPAPGLEIERRRLQAFGGTWLGTCGDSNHTYGYHVPACRVSASDYSRRGAANQPTDSRHGCAIDIGMNWPASRSWLRWLIREIRDDRIQGIAEVIGAYDGRDVRYWSDASGWHEAGVRYTGSGHATWTHVAVYRSTANADHGLLRGWSADGFDGDVVQVPQEGDEDMPNPIVKSIPAGFAFDEVNGVVSVVDLLKVHAVPIPPVNAGGLPWGDAWLSFGCDLGSVKLRVATHDRDRGWGVHYFVIKDDEPREADGKWLQLPLNTGKISIGRMPLSPGDTESWKVPAGYVLEYGRR